MHAADGGFAASIEGESKNGANLHVGLEFSVWRTVRSIAGRALPSPVRSRLRQFSPSRKEAEADTMENEAPPVRPEPVRRRWYSDGRPVKELVPPNPLRPWDNSQYNRRRPTPGESLWRTATVACNAAKRFSSLISSIALSFQTPEAHASGVDWRSACRGSFFPPWLS